MSGVSPATRKTGKRERTHADYWKQRLFRNSYSKDGERNECGKLAVKIQHRGTRETFSLKSTNREIAAREAKDIYAFVLANGMKAAVEKFKGNGTKQTLLTVGDYLRAVEGTGLLRPHVPELPELPAHHCRRGIRLARLQGKV